MASFHSSFEFFDDFELLDDLDLIRFFHNFQFSHDPTAWIAAILGVSGAVFPGQRHMLGPPS